MSVQSPTGILTFPNATLRTSELQCNTLSMEEITFNVTRGFENVINTSNVSSKAVHISNTQAATSTTVGALRVDGGIACGGNLWCSNLVVQGVDVEVGALDLQQVMVAGNTTTRPMSITNTTASSNKTTGALTVAGGVGINGALNALGPLAVGPSTAVYGVKSHISSDGILYTVMEDTTAGTDEKKWWTSAYGASLTHYIANDANSASQIYMQVNRSGYSVSNVKFPYGDVHIGQSYSADIDRKLLIRGRKVNADGYFAGIEFKNSDDAGGTYASIRAKRMFNNYGIATEFWNTLTGSTTAYSVLQIDHLNGRLLSNSGVYGTKFASYYHQSGTINTDGNYDISPSQWIKYGRMHESGVTYNHTVHEGYYLVTGERADANPYERVMGFAFMDGSSFANVIELSGSASNFWSLSVSSGNLRFGNVGDANYPTQYRFELTAISGQIAGYQQY